MISIIMHIFCLISFILMPQLKSRQSQLLWLIWVQHLVCTNAFLLLLKGHFIWRNQGESKKNIEMIECLHNPIVFFSKDLSIEFAICHCHLLDSVTYLIVFFFTMEVFIFTIIHIFRGKSCMFDQCVIRLHMFFF